MEINTTRFGSVDVNPESVIEFPAGLAGLEDNRRFKLLHEGDNPTIFYLQSLDDTDISLSVADPASFGFDYEFLLTDEELALLQLENMDDAAVLMLLYSDETSGEAIPGHKDIRGHLKGPLVLNMGARRGIQKMLTKVQHTTLIRSED